MRLSSTIIIRANGKFESASPDASNSSDVWAAPNFVWHKKSNIGTIASVG
jgi:hypothetical protein